MVVVTCNGSITGAVTSCILIVCDAVDVLPQSSVAVHVLVTLYEPAHAPFVVTSAKVSVNALPHASVAVAVANTGVAGQSMVVVAGNGSITGAVTSCTLIVCDAVDVLPQSSVAVHVLVTLYEPAHAPFVVTSAKVSVNALPHASVAVAVANTGVAGQSMVVVAGNGSITGAVTSCTLIVCDAVDVLPQSSVAVHVLVTLYEPAHAPFVVTSAKVSVNALPHASVAVAVANTGVAGQSMVVVAGNGSITGAVTSCTLIVCDAVDVLPQSSVAVHVLVTLYEPAHAPFVVTSAKVSVNALPHASVAVAVANTGVAGQSMVVVAGNGSITGAVTSCTLIVCDAVDVLPQSSVAVHVLVTLYEPAHAPFVVTSAKVSVNALPHASVAVAVANTGVAGQSMVVVAGNGSITGAVTSCTLIVCDAVDVLPQSSVAVHVLVTLYEPAHAPFVVTSAKVSVNALPHASVAVAVANTGVAGQSMVVVAGNGSITGAVTSCTLIVCDAVDVLPQSSVAVHVLVTLYEPAHAPFVVTSAKVSVNALPHASVAVAVANTGVAGQSMVVVAGNGSITGAVTSCTLIVCDAVDVLPQSSVAVHVLVTLYEPAHAPFVVTSAKVSVNALPHASVAVAVANTGVAGQSMVVVAGNGSITGAVTSCTLIVCDAVDVLPQSSVAVHVLVTLYEPAHAPFVVTSAKVSVNALPHASVAVAVANTGVAGQSMVVVAGNGSITGAVTSCTLIVCDAVDVLPQSSVAVHVLVTLYEPAHAPFVVTSAKVSVNALPHASVAVAVANTGVAGQSMVVVAGNGSITGAVTSCTLIVCDAVDVLPQSSVAVHVLVTLYEPAHAPFVVTSAKVSVNA